MSNGILEEWFQLNLSHPYPNLNNKIELSNQTNYSVGMIGNWFRNRRNQLNKTKCKNDNRLSLKSKTIISDYFFNVSRDPTNEPFQIILALKLKK